MLKLAHADGREGAGLVVLRLVMVDLVDGDGGVYDVGLDCFALNNRLDGLVDVMVDMLARNCGVDRAGLLRLCCPRLVTEASGRLGQLVLHALVVAVVELACLCRGDVVVVLLREDLLVLHGLYGRVIVILVHFLVDGCGDILVLLRLHGLLRYSGRDILVHRRVVVTSLVHELGYGGLCFLHDDV